MIARLLVLVLVAAAPGLATTPGGGSPLTDCLAEFAGTPASSRLCARTRSVPCLTPRITSTGTQTPLKSECGRSSGTKVPVEIW